MAATISERFSAATTTPSLYGRGTVSICRKGTNSSVLVAAICRPKVKNALSDDVYEDMINILDKVSVDPSLSAVVWTGAGSFFSSGADMHDGES